MLRLKKVIIISGYAFICSSTVSNWQCTTKLSVFDLLRLSALQNDTVSSEDAMEELSPSAKVFFVILGGKFSQRRDLEKTQRI